MGTEPRQARWPAHLTADALRVVRWSAQYEETVTFYRDTIGLPVLETFRTWFSSLPCGTLAPGPFPATG